MHSKLTMKKEINAGTFHLLKNNKKMKVCETCNKEFDEGNYTKSHGLKCKGPKLITRIDWTCNVCGMSGVRVRDTKFHFKNCKSTRKLKLSDCCNRLMDFSVYKRFHGINCKFNQEYLILLTKKYIL